MGMKGDYARELLMRLAGRLKMTHQMVDAIEAMRISGPVSLVQTVKEPEGIKTPGDDKAAQAA